jgi:hypothetical protein
MLGSPLRHSVLRHQNGVSSKLMAGIPILSIVGVPSAQLHAARVAIDTPFVGASPGTWVRKCGPALDFEVLLTRGKARATTLHMKHGSVYTPVFMPVVCVLRGGLEKLCVSLDHPPPPICFAGHTRHDQGNDDRGGEGRASGRL